MLNVEKALPRTDGVRRGKAPIIYILTCEKTMPKGRFHFITICFQEICIIHASESKTVWEFLLHVFSFIAMESYEYEYQ